MTKLEQVSEKLKALGVQGSPFTSEVVDTLLATELPAHQVSNTGRFFFQIGDCRVAIKPENLNKQQYTIKVIKAIRDFKNMKEGNCFAIAE